MIRRLLFELLYIFKRSIWDTGISPPELIDFLERHPPGRALELGCGTGTNAITMHRYGWEVVGVDISAYAIRKARQKAKAVGAQIDFILEDVTKLNGVEGTFDLILDIGCLHSTLSSSKAAYASNVRKYLRSNGTFLLYTWLQQSIEGDETPSAEDKLLDLFSGCCECINITRGSDWQSHHPSGWFTFRRVP
jgi:cyclopropane fatty-acyl-phospholipid synthase-like methyltransferase